MTDTTDIKALREACEILNDRGYITESGEICSRNLAVAVRMIIEQSVGYAEQLEAERQRADVAQTLLMPDVLHENTKALVIGFANAMAAKLYKSEQKYGWSDEWMQDDWQDKCLTDFNHHISKGDPLDVANYCAFMHYHGWSTALKGEQVPVALSVWYGSMPESNGKENWTAILHRKGVCISEGITFDRSEYPERVRYAADCMSYLIGEIQDEPDILAYDAGKRSDYVYPVTAPQKPVVLPEAFYPDGDIDCELVINLSDAIAAIEAAGGKVAE
ncbi:hypothetical protein J1779_07790 [Rahnella sp. FC061912-K]|uniref:hypothetical protein n=1 Tax=Rahnella rivi TaxID=2816249 RepID=UPI001C25A825|nr:hypothetical protein [Rahnella rivi]MBU9829831.1 hypothetical protein [Rahnella rivi]